MSLDPQRLRARYGDLGLSLRAASSPLIDHLLDHRSVRAYLPDPVADDELAAIIAAAQSAASSSNLQAWSVVAVRDPATRAALAEYAGARFYRDEAVGLDRAARRVLCRSRPPVPYDKVSINIGSTPMLANVAGAAE